MARSKPCKENIQKKLDDRNIILVGEYLGAKIKTSFTCIKNHEWFATPDNVIRGSGCPKCANQFPLTKAEINNRLLERGLSITGEYLNSNLVSEFSCSYGHKWITKPGNVLFGQGCPHCSNRAPLSKEIINERLMDRNVTMVGEYTTLWTKTEFKCLCGNIWLSSPGNIVNGNGCPQCAEWGFNPSKPAWEYGFTRGGYFKYGVTNDLSRRLNEHRRHGNITLVHERYHEVGQLALDWENSIKQTHGGKYVTKDQCPDGWTETLPISKLQYIIKNMKTNQQVETEAILAMGERIKVLEAMIDALEFELANAKLCQCSNNSSAGE